ncbi:APC amino acid permease [Mycena sanguinolenta]|uniref:APC amino acid permease n=1 Tax=Mycena sanguinolenta TaxID=230812 RepID=A0A8H6Z9W4_9AGAR|nr:APC amino acid permease [Mycena sanguinolenta]
MASIHSSVDDDDKELIALGYVPSFKREFSNLATISFAFSIMGLCSSIATTFNTPLLAGGPSSVVWAWILGACMCFTLGSSIAEIVGWVVGWLNILGQIAGVSSTEFGLSDRIMAAVVIGRDGNFEVTSGKVVGLFAGLLVLHGFRTPSQRATLHDFPILGFFVNLEKLLVRSFPGKSTLRCIDFTSLSYHHYAARDDSSLRDALCIIRSLALRAS